VYRRCANRVRRRDGRLEFTPGVMEISQRIDLSNKKHGRRARKRM
jgi:hypothetical protein